MHMLEDLLRQLREVHGQLSEASPPPFKPAERAKEGMKPLPGPKLKGRSGATPPPLPKKKEPSTDSRAALADIKKMHAPKVVARGRDLSHKFDLTNTESLSATAAEIRNLIGEAAYAKFAGMRISNQPVIRRPIKKILRPKALVAAGSKLKPGTSAGPAM